MCGCHSCGAAINPHGDAGERERFAIAPDASDSVDRPFAQPDREVREIGIGRGRDRSASTATLTAAGALCGRDCHFLELGRPDDLARNANAPGDLGDRGTFGRSLNPQAIKARPFLCRVAHRWAEQPVVDEAANRGRRSRRRDLDKRRGTRRQRRGCGGEEKNGHSFLVLSGLKLDNHATNGSSPLSMDLSH